MTITFCIHNATYNLVDVVMLRKFFQMVFVGNDRKSLHIYTATVIGGLKSKNTSKMECAPKKNKTQYTSELNELKEFYMKFGFIVTGNDDNEVLNIISENVTEEEHDFLFQEECIQQVWGEQCKVIHNNYHELENKYCDFMGIKKENFKSANELSPLAQSKVLWVQDKSKEEEMCALAISGSFSSEDYISSEKQDTQTGRKNFVNDGSEKAFYLVKVPKDSGVCKGIELLNWVKTTINFKHRLNEQNMNFCIKKGSEDNTSYIAPDFTWYFSPPVKSYINYESSSAEVRWQKKEEDDNKCPLHDDCKCPVKPDIKSRLTSKRYDNIINPVANKTTVNFYRWTKDEMIGYRQKYRLMAKNIFYRPDIFKDVKELNLFVDTTDEHNRGNRQYILGIFISFALAFGIDNTRLKQAQQYFPFEQLFKADAWWLALLVAVTLNLLIRPVRGIGERKYVYWRTVNYVSSFIWIFAVFCVDKSKILMDLFSTYIGYPIMEWVGGWLVPNINYYAIPRIIFVLILVSNTVYVCKNVFKYHDPILTDLFGGDIL